LSTNHSSPTARLARFDDEIARDKLADAMVTFLRGLQASKPLSMTSEVMDSNFPFSDTADIANDL